MPLPLIVILGGILAGGTAVTGIVKGGKAIMDNSEANDVNDRAQSIYDKAKRNLEAARNVTGKALEDFGNKKMDCCQFTLKQFIELYKKIHNIEAAASAGIDELSSFKIDKQGVAHFEELSNLATSMAAGTATGVVAGSAVAFGAYGAAGALATASTGTAISALSGAAATNATLAFFGGGSLAAGGLGMAGGAAVLGGIVAGPALMVLGLVMGAKASAKLDNAYANLEQAQKAEKEIGVLVTACKAIKERADLFTKLLIKVDLMMIKFNSMFLNIIAEEGTDYNDYSDNTQEYVHAWLATAKAYKALIDTPLLDQDGKLLDNSLEVAEAVQKQLAG